MGKEAAEKPVVGVDLGGTKVLAGVVDREYKILQTAKRATKGEMGVDAVVARIAKSVREATKEAGLQLTDLGGVCSGAPGALNPDDGIVRFAPNIEGWEDVPFAKLLSDELGGVPVFIENDANLGALGELKLGAARGVKNMVGIFVGTGIGGGDGAGWQDLARLAPDRGRTRSHGRAGGRPGLQLRQPRLPGERREPELDRTRHPPGTARGAQEHDVRVAEG